MMIINDFFFFSLENGICIRIIQNFCRRFCSNKEQKCNNFIKSIHASIRRLIVLDYFTNKRWFEIVSLLFLFFVSCQFDKMTLHIVIVHREKENEREREWENDSYSQRAMTIMHTFAFSLSCVRHLAELYVSHHGLHTLSHMWKKRMI